MAGRSRRAAGAAAALLLVLVGVGCSDDDSDDDAVETEDDAAGTVEEGDDSEDEGDAAGGDGEAGVIEVTARDYEFEGVPDTIPAGSTISLTTEEGGEPHEFVVFARPDGETRSIDELSELPQEELETIFAGEPALVTIAMPGTTDTPGAVVGDGTLAAGEYIYVCTFPQGTTPEDVESSQGPLEGDTPPHFVLGMRGEFSVE